jgi:Rab GDP dissociation inhibitor
MFYVGRGWSFLLIKFFIKIFGHKNLSLDSDCCSDKVKKTGQVVRCICLLDHPIPNTKDGLSTQIIIPQKQVAELLLESLF